MNLHNFFRLSRCQNKCCFIFSVYLNYWDFGKIDGLYFIGTPLFVWWIKKSNIKEGENE